MRCTSSSACSRPGVADVLSFANRQRRTCNAPSTSSTDNTPRARVSMASNVLRSSSSRADTYLFHIKPVASDTRRGVCSKTSPMRPTDPTKNNVQATNCRPTPHDARAELFKGHPVGVRCDSVNDSSSARLGKPDRRDGLFHIMLGQIPAAIRVQPIKNFPWRLGHMGLCPTVGSAHHVVRSTLCMGGVLPPCNGEGHAGDGRCDADSTGGGARMLLTRGTRSTAPAPQRPPATGTASNTGEHRWVSVHHQMGPA